MTRTNALAMLLLGSVLTTGCGISDSSAADDGGDDSGGSGDNYAGTDNNAGGADLDDEGADVLPTYPTQHPRIYIEKNRARLEAALEASTPASSRFRSMVDSWVAGADI